MNFTKGMRILVVAAHPDDEVLGCGGTLAKAIAAGAEVAVIFLGEGISARFPIGCYDSEEFRTQTRLRMESAREALQLLGIADFEFGERLCGQFDTYPLISIVKDIERKMEQFKPNMLFSHNSSEVNIDHRISYEAVEVACRPTRDFIATQIYTFEIPCSGSWTFESSFKPNVFVEVSEYWDKKLAAWSCYVGEARPFPFPRSSEGLKTLAHYRGMMSNLKLAEAFCMARMIVK
jgi:LmbE family N-acetylglucosaminyl deacetylase